ncbi:MAG: hypothetical protein ACK4VZ_06070 [Paracoccaceae bacterium]
MEVQVTDLLSCLDGLDALAGLGAIVPVWIKSQISKARSEHMAAAMASGGLVGCHRGRTGAFRAGA